MQKSNSILAKAINEADTIKAGALRNANELLMEMFQPKIKEYLNKAVNEQMSTQEATPSGFDTDAGEDGVENPEDTINVGGEGAPLLEQEDDLEDPDEIVEIDDEDEDDLMDEQMNPDPEDEDSLDEYDDEIDDLEEQDDIDLDDEDSIEEQEDFEDEDSLDEQDEFDSLDDDDIVEIDDELLESADDDSDDDDDDDDEVNEDYNDVNISQDEDVPMAANESFLRRVNRKLKRENAMLKKQTRINNFGIKKLKSKLSEVNLFNQKLAYSMRAINRNGGLTTNEKRNIIAQFDNCKSLREVKLTYNAINKFGKKNSRGKISESTRRMFNKINENKSNKPSSSFDSRTLKMAGLE